jgi:hypothetical protein
MGTPVKVRAAGALAHVFLGVAQMFTKRAAHGIAECECAGSQFSHRSCFHRSCQVRSGPRRRNRSSHNEALRLSPRDTFAYTWMVWVGLAKAQLAWLRRGLDANRNFPAAHFVLAAALARLGELDHAAIVVLPGRGATIRPFLPGANATLRACAWPGRLRAEGLTQERATSRFMILILPDDVGLAAKCGTRRR